jgi:F-type H+-transporting ATPase subunit b
MKTLQAENERILKEARAERDAILKEAKEIGLKMIEESRDKAKTEGQKLIESAKLAIKNERNSAIADMKAQIATFSVDIAESLVKESLASDDKQKSLVSKMVQDIQLN